jgi:hypothetical protein
VEAAAGGGGGSGGCGGSGGGVFGVWVVVGCGEFEVEFCEDVYIWGYDMELNSEVLPILIEIRVWFELFRCII